MQYCIIQVTCFKQNCSIIWCDVTREAAIVDPGGNFDKLVNKINTLEIKISKILLTHGHVDHVGCAMELKHYYNVLIFGPNQADRLLLNDLRTQCNALGIPFPYSMKVSVSPDIWLDDGDEIHIGREVLYVLHCPGHSPGHIVYWNKMQKFIVMGDVLFKNSVGRTDLPGGDFKILMSSIKNKLFTLGDDIMFLPGHGAISTLGDERVHNSFIV
ncbi:MBL fold metallo-hydrolase [Candidatus Blochmannia ocreatus (nom. nud.)]|uniref:MBL fold metallo-hydrolase n=1 Tax=Candidatus Blochmannia ocreatus (nom. nud.) TaxID=251538 RepID=A0ABY4SSF2_9ENTR|nr:MBL fold metallo-hydrolase [Candidatus Blochmannia ocreatus]URJ24921.1 MBL fold metallo-hydrolase [Candidatus Blochmannia ocreatus]